MADALRLSTLQNHNPSTPVGMADALRLSTLQNHNPSTPVGRISVAHPATHHPRQPRRDCRAAWRMRCAYPPYKISTPAHP